MTQTNDNAGQPDGQIDAARNILARLDGGHLTSSEARDELSALFVVKSEGPTYQKAWG